MVLPRRLSDILVSRPELSAVSSHQARLPALSVRGIHIIPILFLRHPLDRFGSVYEYERAEPLDSLSPSAVVARTGDLRSFAEWTVSPEATAVSRNFQVGHLAGIDHDMRAARPTNFHALLARARLEELPVYGLVDRFDESMQRFAGLIRRSFPAFEAQYSISNVSHRRVGKLERRIEEIRDSLGGALYAQLEDANRLDLDLYNLFATRFDQFSPPLRARAA